MSYPSVSQFDSELRVLWGAPAIAAAINRPLHATYRALEHGTLPGAKKIAGRYCFSPDVFFAELTGAPVD